jgi:serine protease Do
MRFYFSLLALAVATFVLPNALAAQYPSPNQVLLAMQPRVGSSYLGVGLMDIDSNRAKAIHLGEARGVEVMRVEEDSPAEDAGIRVGDVLLSYNGEHIVGAQQVGRLVAETPVGRKVKVEYWRAGKQQNAYITTGSARFSGFGASGGSTVGSDHDIPDLRSFTMVDIPDPLLIWKNAVLGIVCESLDSQLARYFGVKQGVLVRSVDEDSPAGKSGVRAGDVITGIGDRVVSNPRDVSSYLRMGHGSTLKSVSLELTRERKPLVVKVSFPDGLE